MVSSLLRRMIREPDPRNLPQYRKKVGRFASIIGIIVNLILFSIKLGAGTLTHSVAVIGDAFNNLSDAGTSLLTMLSFYFAAKPPDEAHPFGHARMEYLFSAAAAFAIIYLGIQIGLESIQKIFQPEDTSLQLTALLLLLLSVLIKLGLYLFYKSLSRTIDSDMLRAAATDSLSDVLATTAIVLSLLAFRLFGWQVDGWMGGVVALIIAKAGIDILRSSVDKLLGVAASEDTKKEIESFVLGYPGIHGVHDLVVHDYGPGRTLASIHAEMDGKEDFFRNHDTVDRIEVDAKSELGLELIIHLDPIDFDDPRIPELMLILQNSLQEMNPQLRFHDFRMIESHYTTNLVFDVMKPRDCQLTEEAITAQLDCRFQVEDPRLRCIITFDSPY